MASGLVPEEKEEEELLLLHPELLSQEFLLLTLEQKNIVVENDTKSSKDGLTDLYVQHAIPLPQRDLPKSRWGKMMEKKREQKESKNENKSDVAVGGLRKRPLIVFDGSSTSTSIKVRKTENGANDGLRPPPSAHATTGPPLRKLSHPSSPSVSPPALPTDVKAPTPNGSEQNHVVGTGRSSLANVKSPPSSPVGGPAVVKLKRAAPKEEAESVNDLKPTEAKRKIQHVTWP
ncbi:LOW QUALITY PROTEIN: ashwin [Tachyglossus aculeatus]|uniref:LOW QUALITY PROTEIN: ashwin n=1 Tax=Tachyglossus aculeatus TaxID=9261 RepID=UPI0018F6AFFF|nr:LOW QUALITY PROTEIN: ashwin [Tachyglossus aculeatus]